MAASQLRSQGFRRGGCVGREGRGDGACVGREEGRGMGPAWVAGVSPAGI